MQARNLPDLTYSPDDPDLPDWRPVAGVIVWSEPDGSIWKREFHDGRKQPLKNLTMQRMVKGIRHPYSDKHENRVTTG